jgi:hypothetical protein
MAQAILSLIALYLAWSIHRDLVHLEKVLRRYTHA